MIESSLYYYTLQGDMILIGRICPWKGTESDERSQKNLLNRSCQIYHFVSGNFVDYMTMTLFGDSPRLAVESTSDSDSDATMIIATMKRKKIVSGHFLLYNLTWIRTTLWLRSIDFSTTKHTYYYTLRQHTKFLEERKNETDQLQFESSNNYQSISKPGSKRKKVIPPEEKLMQSYFVHDNNMIIANDWLLRSSFGCCWC